MIKSIYKLLNSNEKKYFNYIFFLLCLNSIFELISLAVFYPLIKFLIDDTYGLTVINNYLLKLNYENINSNELILFYLTSIWIVFLLKNIFYFFYIYEVNRFIKKIRLRTSNELVEKYINLEYPIFFNKTLANILRNIDLSINFSTIVLALLTYYSEVLVFLILIIFLLNIEFNLTLVIIISMTFLIFVFKRYSKDIFYQLGVISQKYAERLKKEILQMFSGIREIKILKKELFFNKKFNKINSLEAQNNLVRDVLLQLPKVAIETTVVTLLVIIISSMLILEFDKAEVIIYISLIIIASARLMPASIRIISSLQRLKFSQSPNEILIKELYEKKNLTVNSNKKTNEKILPFKKKITFSTVSFYYTKKNNILKNLNFDIKKGSCLGIVGPSGSGKSTFTDLIMGLLTPTSGQIKIDNLPLLKNIDSWQNKISYVSQSPFFLNDTIEKNIAFGVLKNKIDKKLIIEVSKKAQIYDYIKNLTLKFKTKIGEKGINFSGGQLQRIAIARALYKKSELLILDESTNSLDNENESDIFEFLKKLKKELTIIIISHKSENLSICDKIYEINNHEIQTK